MYHLGILQAPCNSDAEKPLKFQSKWTILDKNLTAWSLRKFLQ